MAIDTLGGGRIEPQDLAEEMRTSYLDYAMSVIVSRALPDVRDGLKPVHRRVLHSMNEAGLQPGRPYSKCSRVVGDVLGKYHPHGDTAAYDALVRMAQWFSLRYPLVDGQGNFGNQDGYGAAAMRYTECRLGRLAVELLRDIDADTVDFVPNYDGRQRQPTVLPARFPNLLVNGSAGIAVGMATNIPPHNLAETIDACIELIDNPDATLDDLMTHMKGPDFPTGATIMGMAGIREAYETGRGRVVMRARVHHRGAQGRPQRADRDRGALPGQARRRRRPREEDRRACHRQGDPRDLRRQQPLRPQRHPADDRAQARRHPQGRAEQALQAHAAAEHVRREHGRAGRRHPAHALAAPDARPLPRPPEGGRHPAHQVRARPRRAPGARARGLPDRARQPRRGHRPDPRPPTTPTPPARG